MDRNHLAIVLLTALCAAYVGVTGYAYPENNWDLIGYVASALRNAGLTGAELHRATYDTVLSAVPADRVAALTERSGYIAGVYRDPVALEQQLPFYRIRIAYVWLLQAVAVPAGGLVHAAYLVSGIATFALCLLTGWMLYRRAPGLHWAAFGIALAATLHICSVVSLSRLATPDALVALMGLAALALFYRARGVALALVACLPLVRTDTAILAPLLLLLLLAERDRNRWHYAALALAVGAYVAVNSVFGNYGHAAVFNFTLIPGMQTPYPAAMEIARDLSVYRDVYRDAVLSMLTRWVTIVLALAAVAVAFERWRSGRISPGGRLALVCIFFVLIHFLLFPMGASRHYGFSLLFCSVFATARLAKTSRKTMA